MNTVTLSPKFQVVIPLAVREALTLRPGAKFQVVSLDGRIELVPVLPMAKARGMLRLRDTEVDREAEDRR
jgi:AbrB family looped-hinge helix DNA binding protein